MNPQTIANVRRGFRMIHGEELAVPDDKLWELIQSCGMEGGFLGGRLDPANLSAFLDGLLKLQPAKIPEPEVVEATWKGLAPLLPSDAKLAFLALTCGQMMLMDKIAFADRDGLVHTAIKSLKDWLALSNGKLGLELEKEFKNDRA